MDLSVLSIRRRRFRKKNNEFNLISKKPGQCVHDISAVFDAVIDSPYIDDYMLAEFMESALVFGLIFQVNDSVKELITTFYEKIDYNRELQKFKILDAVFNRPGFQKLDMFFKNKVFEICLDVSPRDPYCTKRLRGK